MTGTSVPFPSGAAASNAGEGQKITSSGMSIEIPSRTSSGGSSNEDRKEQQHGGTGTRAFHHHPRQPGPSSDSYFSGSITGSSAGGPGHPRTPGQQWRGHSRNASQASAASAAPKSQAMTASMSGNAVPASSHHLQQHSGVTTDWGTSHQQPEDWHRFGGAGLPSPSTLTDILLGLHSTLYGAKRSPEEVREMVWRFYDADASKYDWFSAKSSRNRELTLTIFFTAFESPLLSAKGRDQVANQFIMAFALPGMDVTSELRDVICSDFEFDGTRAGIIDQTISVTFLPSIFGSDPTPPPSAYPYDPAGQETPAPHHLQGHSAITPHPFADYRTPGASAFGHLQHSPTTPFSLSHLWGGGSSRPHTPGGATSSSFRPLTSSMSSHNRTDGHLSGSKSEDDYNAIPGSVYASADQTGGGSVSRLKMPLDAIVPHWGSEGLGRGTVANFLWGILHPRAVLKQFCTIHLRLMSRLEFNDAGHIVRHEDTWGLRETIEGTIPFASLIYALERRVVGYITSWAVAKGFSLSAALSPRPIGPPTGAESGKELALYADHKHDHPYTADDAAHALLGRSRGTTYRQHENFQTISRSRAPSPTRFGWHSGHTQSAAPFVTGTRSRARSSASLYGSRAASTDNLVGLGAGTGSQPHFATGYERGADKELPPDSSARYRGSLHKRLESGRPSSTTSAPPHELAGSAAGFHGGDEYGRTRAPDRDSIL